MWPCSVFPDVQTLWLSKQKTEGVYISTRLIYFLICSALKWHLWVCALVQQWDNCLMKGIQRNVLNFIFFRSDHCDLCIVKLSHGVFGKSQANDACKSCSLNDINHTTTYPVSLMYHLRFKIVDAAFVLG